MLKLLRSVDSRWITNLFCVIPLFVLAKFLFGIYLYPRQDSVIYQTFRMARKYPENYARDLFAGLEKTHFDFFWHLAAKVPDSWLVEPGVATLTYVTWLILFSGIYTFIFTLTKSHQSSLIGVFAMLWTKSFFGLALFGYSFIHTDLIYAFVLFGLSLFFSGQRILAVSIFAVLSNFYPPLAYFFVAPFFLFILREHRILATIKCFLLYLVLFSPMLISYFERGVLNLVLDQSEPTWKDYFLINLETIFRLFPLTTAKLNYISSFVGAALIYLIVIRQRKHFSKIQQLFVRCWECYLIYAILCILLTWLEYSVVLKLQLIRTTMIPVVFSLIGITFLATPHWQSARRREKVLFLLSLLSSQLLVVLAGTLYFLHYKQLKGFAPSGAIILLIAIALTAKVHFPPMLGHSTVTPWFDVAQAARTVLPTKSLTLIPPVADMNFCETDDYVTFRLLAQRSTTLKVSDGVEVSYSSTFAKHYIDYLETLSQFLGTTADFSNACAFRRSFYNGWTSKSVQEIVSFAQSIKADFLLIHNHHRGMEKISDVVIKGEKYSVVEVNSF